jgi:hypothetical protein
VEALQEVEGAGQKDQENGRSHLLPEADSAAQPDRVEHSAAFLPEQHPADRVLEPAVARLGLRLEARRPLVVAGQSAQASVARPQLLGRPAAALPRKRPPRAPRGLRVLESLGVRKPARRPNPALVVGKPPERRAAQKRPPASPAAVLLKRAQRAEAPVPAPRAGLSPVAEAERAPVQKAAPGDRFFCPRAQRPRRGYSQVAAPFTEYYCRHSRAFARPTRVRIDAGERRTT